MAALPTALRKQLDKAIQSARQVAERGAKQALESLAVERHEPHGSMTPEQRQLRNRLRAHGRQLGDVYDREKGTQTIARLVREVAYEHWHRMLFARFLAENGLLIEPTHGVPVSLAECEELARERDEDPWVLAARFAERMLPAIFRPDDPALAVALPPEARQELERLLAALPAAVFTSDDALGWTYQFWQSAEKAAVNARVKSGEKITGETLPAVTQLFTEHYMVLFLLHNTLGAWHAGKVLAARHELARSAASEAELRFAAALPGYEWEYLRFVRETREGDEEGQPSGPWRPAAGYFPTWPQHAAELKVLDPCCGSGHFLVAALEILVRLRMQEEGLALQPAIRAVLAENLHGLELDQRCTQIAAFNLALAAWKWVEKPIELPALQIACCGLGPAASKAEWLELAERAAADGGMPAKRDLFGREESLLSDALRSGFEALYELFEKAPELGSLIDPATLPSDLYRANFQVLEPLLAKVLEAADDDTRERAVAAAGMTRAARILMGPSGGYTLVVTNVPYLGRESHTEGFRAWVDKNHKESKNNLATVFLSRILRWLGVTGTVGVITPQNWLSLPRFRKLREKLLQGKTWTCVARLGSGAFETIGGHVVNVALISISGVAPDDQHEMAGIDVSGAQSPFEKATLLRGESVPANVPVDSAEPGAESVPEPTLVTERTPELLDAGESTDSDFPSTTANGSVRLIQQSDLLKNPDARVVFSFVAGAFLKSIADSRYGLRTGDGARFILKYWELDKLSNSTSSDGWQIQQSCVDNTVAWGGQQHVLLWNNGCAPLGTYFELGVASKQGMDAWGRSGVVVSLMSDLPVSLYAGDRFDNNCAVIWPSRELDLPAVWTFCSSDAFGPAVRRIDQTLKVMNQTLLKIPFDLAKWQRIAAERYPRSLPEPQSNDPSQWLFHGHPAGMLATGAPSRSRFGVGDPVGGERHPSLISREINPRDVLQVAVARLLGYRWPPENDDTMRLDVAARAWASQCHELDALADDDGIACLAPVHGEPSAADRLRRLIKAAFAHVPGGLTALRERELLFAATGDDQTLDSLDGWLREQFFEQHCALFHSRPFVWHVWDGRTDGFGALVNYHRLAAPDGEGRRTLESLAFTYLGEWIDRQRAEQREGREGADARLAAALRLQAELERILEGEPPYDLFVRWKPLHEQPIGWEPDINDGVRLNIRPFLLAADMGRKGSGLLRARPKGIKWDKAKVDKPDRGKEPESLRPSYAFPWFWGCDPEGRPEHRTGFGSPLAGSAPAGKPFDGKRWNDLHYTRAAKEAARAAAGERAAP